MTASEHRARARAALKGKWIWAVLITLLASILGGIAGSTPNVEIDLPSRSDINININVSEEFATSDIPLDELDQEIIQSLENRDIGTFLEKVLTELLPEILVGFPPFLWAFLVIAILLSIAVSLAFSLFIGGPVQLGYRKYTLNLMDGAPAEIGDAFSEFSRMGRAAKYRLLHNLIEFAFALPFLILLSALAVMLIESMGNGLARLIVFLLIMAVSCGELYVSYGLVMWDFVLADNPHCSVREAMRRSWALMNGRRWDYFFLGLSFIGWGILAAFTFGIGGLFLNPYQQVSFASFYRELVPAPAAPAQEPEPPQDYDYKLIPESDPSA